MNRRNFLRSAFVTAAAVTGLARARIELTDGPGAEPVTGTDFGQDERTIVGHVRAIEASLGEPIVATIETARVRPTDGRAVIRVLVAGGPLEVGQLVSLNDDGTVG